MNRSTFIQTAAYLAVGLIVVAASSVKSSPLNSTPTATTANPMAVYAHDVAKAIRRAETGAMSIEDR